MNWNNIPERREEPDFGNLLKILQKRIPDRPTLFEFFFNERIYKRIVPDIKADNPLSWYSRSVKTFYRLGYDYSTILVPGFRFSDPELHNKKESISLNDGIVIRNREEFEKFEWPDPNNADYELLNSLGDELPEGMKLIPYTPDGVLENVIRLMGFDELCYKLFEDPQLVENIFKKVGSILLEFYKKLVSFDCVGACIANDDWGFKTSTLLSPETLQKFVFPWYKKIVNVVKASGKPVILHSCGYFIDIIEDIIEDIKFDGRHSYEDLILPVEKAYDLYHKRIAILGGIDVDFICQSEPEDIYKRASSMLERSAERGSYALGTGNSVPEYMPEANFFAMIRAAH